MVIFQLYDDNGKVIPHNRMNIIGSEETNTGDELIKLQVYSTYDCFTKSELITILNLIQNEVEYGVPMDRTVELIELHKKIKKIIGRKLCK